MVAPLERKVRNNYLKVLEQVNSLFVEAKAGLKTSYQFHLKKGNNPDKKDYEPTLKNMKNFLFHCPNDDKAGTGDKRRQLDKLLQKQVNISNSLEQSEFNLSLFYDYGFIKYFKKTINHLQTALEHKLSFKSGLTGYEFAKASYYCRDKFCLVSKKKKVEETKELLIPSLIKLRDYDSFRTSFFTISPNNIEKKYFTKEIFKNFGEVCFKIFNRRLSKKTSQNFPYKKYEERLTKAFKANKFSPFDKIKNEEIYYSNLKELYSLTPNFLSERPKLKQYFKGYFGVPEIVENEKDINLHQHFVIVRPSDFEKGFVSKFYIEELVKECFNNWGCSVFKGSSIIDIRSKTKAGKDDIDSVLDYLLVDYFLKGVKVKSKSFWKDLIVASEGIRFERSGGLLARNKLKENALVYELEKKVHYGLLGLIDNPKHILIGGKLNYKKDDYVKQPLKFPISTLKCLEKEYIESQIHLKLLYTPNGSKTSFYKILFESMFGKNPLLCPFSKDSLKLDSLIEDSFETQAGDPSFIYSSLISMSKKFKSSTLEFEAEDFLNKIYPPKFADLTDSYLQYVELNLLSVAN